MAEWEQVPAQDRVWQDAYSDITESEQQGLSWIRDEIRASQDPMLTYEQDLGGAGQARLGMGRFFSSLSGMKTLGLDIFGADEEAARRRDVAQAGNEAWERNEPQRTGAADLGEFAGAASTAVLPGKILAQAGYSAAQELGQAATTEDSAARLGYEALEGGAWGMGFGVGGEIVGRTVSGLNSGRNWAAEEIAEASRRARVAAGPDPRVASMSEGGAGPTGVIDDLPPGRPPRGPGGGGGGAAGGGAWSRWQDEAEDMGFQLGRADRTQNQTMMNMERAAARDPTVAEFLDKRYAHNDRVLGAAVADGLGVPADAGGRITVTMMDDALTQIEGTYNRLGEFVTRNGGLDVDTAVIDNIIGDLSNSQNGTQALEAIVGRFDGLTSGKLSAKDWQSVRSRIRKEAKTFSNNGDQAAADELFNLSNYLDDAADEMLGDAAGMDGGLLKDEYRLARQRYRNFLAVERGSVLGQDGLINEQSLYNALRAVKGREFTMGRSRQPIDRAGRVAKQLQRYRQGSDTAMNEWMMQSAGKPLEMAKSMTTGAYKRAYLGDTGGALTDFMMGHFPAEGLFVGGGGAIERGLDPAIGEL